MVTRRRPSLTDAARTGVASDQVASRTERYLRHFSESRDGTAHERKKSYAQMVNDYYDLMTDFYENGWGQSFHFAPRSRGESFRESIVRHEHYVALRLRLKPGMRVLDVGCGVGGPMRNIARASGAHITGINNNDYQVRRGNEHNQRASLYDRCRLIKGDFLDMPFEDCSFDAAFAIESTCHAPDRGDVYSEVWRVLKPEGLFTSYEWCLTDLYDATDPRHVTVKQELEEGNALPELIHTSAVLAALQRVGFEVVDSRDMADDSIPEAPWYLPLSARAPLLTGWRNGPFGRRAIQLLVDALERLRIAPRGARQVHAILCRSADALVAAGELGMFTPMFFVLAKKREPRTPVEFSG